MRNETRLPRDHDHHQPLGIAAPPARPAIAAGHLGLDVASHIWRATEFGSPVSTTISSGWEALNKQLPGAGWPCQSLTEILSPQPSVCEWRLIGHALRQVVSNGSQVIVIAPPKHPHLPGLAHEGLDQRHLVWIQPKGPAERLWVTEQMIRSNSAGAVVAWLPQARQEQIRRLQFSAQGCDGLVFLFRPESAQDEASAAPLRLLATFGVDWELRVQVFKRKGPICEGVLVLPSVPGGLSCVLTPRIRRPSLMIVTQENPYVVGSVAPQAQPERLATH